MLRDKLRSLDICVLPSLVWVYASTFFGEHGSNSILSLVGVVVRAPDDGPERCVRMEEGEEFLCRSILYSC